MCISAFPSIMFNTSIYAGQAHHNGKLVHVLAYQNNAENMHNGPNAMVIPFPTEMEMGPENAIDTSKFKKFLGDIDRATKRKMFSRSLDFKGMAAAGTAGRAQVFDVGSYTVVLANHVKQIPEALRRVPANKRPELSVGFLIRYNQLYKDQPVAVCCFDGDTAPEPLLWWYEPSDPTHLFIPTMDAHDGNMPDLQAEVDMDHIISVGSSVVDYGNSVYYSDNIPPEVKNLLPRRVHGTKLKASYRNGDMFVKTSELAATSGVPTLVKRASLDADVIASFGMDGWE